MNLLIVDGVTLPTPDKMQYDTADLQSEGYRDELGVLHKTTIRWDVRTLKVSWSRGLSNEELLIIDNATKQKEYMTVQYFTESGNHSGVMTAYRGANRSKELYRVEDSGKALWKGYSIDLIEQ